MLNSTRFPFTLPDASNAADAPETQAGDPGLPAGTCATRPNPGRTVAQVGH